MIENFITTRSGIQFSFDEQDSPIEIKDIAHALSHICRFNGHTKEFYCVADHCVRMFDIAKESVSQDQSFLRAVLLHDATEAYLGDVTRPLKNRLDAYKDLEYRLARRIERAFDLPFKALEDPEIKQLDQRMLATEAFHMLDISPSGRGGAWCGGAEPFYSLMRAGSFKTRTPMQARVSFLARYVTTCLPAQPEPVPC